MKRISNILTAAGVMIALLGAAFFTIITVIEKSAQKHADETVTQIYELSPDITGGTKDDRTDTDMPIMQINGEDFIGILEIPALDKKLPLCNDNNSYKLLKYPCRYFGSIYDKALVIGANNVYQSDFIKLLSNGDKIALTDMTGVRFEYTVIQTLTVTDPDSLPTSDLVIFTKDRFGTNYYALLCTVY